MMECEREINFAEFADLVTNKTGLQKKQVKLVLDTSVKTLVDLMLNNVQLKIKGFGVFYTIERSITKRETDMDTGTIVGVGQKSEKRRMIMFRACRSMKKL